MCCSSSSSSSSSSISSDACVLLSGRCIDNQRWSRETTEIMRRELLFLLSIGLCIHMLMTAHAGLAPPHTVIHRQAPIHFLSSVVFLCCGDEMREPPVRNNCGNAKENKHNRLQEGRITSPQDMLTVHQEGAFISRSTAAAAIEYISMHTKGFRDFWFLWILPPPPPFCYFHRSERERTKTRKQ